MAAKSLYRYPVGHICIVYPYIRLVSDVMRDPSNVHQYFIVSLVQRTDIVPSLLLSVNIRYDTILYLRALKSRRNGQFGPAHNKYPVTEHTAKVRMQYYNVGLLFLAVA